MALISVPSWVIPGTYAENLKFLENKKEIDGVELLFFIYDNETEKQFDSEWEKINGYRERFVFTAHLPESLLPAHEGLVARLAPLVRHFIVHPSAENPAAQAVLLKEWALRFGAVFLAENTFAKRNVSPLEVLLPHLGAGAGLCMDTGHLLLEGNNPADYFRERYRSVGEIHLHGVDRKQAAADGRLADHRRILGGEKWLIELLPMLKNFGGVINLEVFSWEEASAGIEVLKNELDL